MVALTRRAYTSGFRGSLGRLYMNRFCTVATKGFARGSDQAARLEPHRPTGEPTPPTPEYG
jgi:hypothetical protein